MAQDVFSFAVRIDPEDREACFQEIERILLKYGDQPHTRARRDAELQRCVEVLGQCVQFEPIQSA